MQNVKVTDYYTFVIIIELALILTREIRRKIHDYSFFLLFEIFLTHCVFILKHFFNIFGLLEKKMDERFSHKA